jgi:hypothetical protein
MSPRPAPTPADLADAPELAILAALEAIVDLALRALVSEHPQLADPECPAWARQNTPASDAAHRILAATRPLSNALAAYCRAIANARHDPTDTDPSF